MGNILFESKGENYQVPGLPYDESYTYVRSVVLDEITDVDDIKKILETSDKDTLTNPMSLAVIRGFRDYIPTTFRRVTHNMPAKMQEEYFGISGDWIPEQDRTLLQLQTEIEAKSATIDAAIVHGRRDLGTVVNKAHLLNRLYMIGRLYKHLNEREYPFLFGDLRDPNHWDDALSEMKQQATEYLLEIPMGSRRYPKKIRQVEVSKKDLEKKYFYINWLKEKLGDNLMGVLLYGSAARTDDPAKYSDFDNWVRVKDLKKAHQILKGSSPVIYEGKVVELYGAKYPEGAKHLGIHLFPESEQYLLRHIRLLHDSREFLKHTKVLHGEFPFLKVRQDEVIERGISQAYVKLKTIAGSLNWAYFYPEKMIGKQSLFEFIVKNVRFFLQHSLNAIEGPQFRDKEDLNKLLADRGLHIPEYKPDADYIRESLAYSMVAVLKLQKELNDINRKPNLEFLIDEKIYKDWDAEVLEQWKRME